MSPEGCEVVAPITVAVEPQRCDGCAQVLSFELLEWLEPGVVRLTTLQISGARRGHLDAFPCVGLVQAILQFFRCKRLRMPKLAATACNVKGVACAQLLIPEPTG